MASRRPPDPLRPTPAAGPAKKAPKRAAAARSAPAVEAAPVPVALPPAAKARKPRAPRTAGKGAVATSPALRVSADERRGMIAKAAYLRGERRGFAPGGEAEDWLMAEKEIDALLSGGAGAAQ